jgi:uncharacterized repeat protein (TIGR03847 family)
MPRIHDLGNLAHISAEAIGQPGQRRFRLCVMNARFEAASLWMEKEQLAALGDTIETALRDESYRYEPPPLDDRDPGFVESGAIEIRVARLSMGLNREDKTLLLFAADAPTDQDSDHRVDVAFTYRRAHELRNEIAGVVSAGRPPCPLCGGPLDPDRHVCVRTNGHHPD